MRLFTLRGPVLRVPWLLVIAGWAGIRLWGLLRWLAAHGVATLAMLGALGLWLLVAAGLWPWLLVAAGLMMAGTVVAMEMRPRWYRQAVENLASWRRRRAYDALWEQARVGAGLTRGDDLPTLMAHRWAGILGERDTDVLTVHMLPGQLVSDWRAQSVRLAAALGLQRVRCHVVPGTPGDVQLFGRRYRELTPRVTEQRVRLHPTVQPTVQLQAVPDDMEELSTAVDEPVERGAFPRRPRGVS
jgi:hypothetical protein